MKEKLELLYVSPTVLKGKITENKCATWLLEQGYIVSIPEVPCQYDLLVDIQTKILKIQVKTCHLVNDESGIEFNVSSTTNNTKGFYKKLYTEDGVDYFMTYHEDKYYLVPLSECGTRSKKLRFSPPKNGQTKNICFAKDYLAEDVLKKEGNLE